MSVLSTHLAGKSICRPKRLGTSCILLPWVQGCIRGTFKSLSKRCTYQVCKSGHVAWTKYLVDSDHEMSFVVSAICARQTCHLRSHTTQPLNRMLRRSCWGVSWRGWGWHAASPSSELAPLASSPPFSLPIESFFFNSKLFDSALTLTVPSNLCAVVFDVPCA
jgi:hypothetical protein